MEGRCVFCEAGYEYLNDVSLNFSLQKNMEAKYNPLNIKIILHNLQGSVRTS
jgi:hypothetical protein